MGQSAHPGRQTGWAGALTAAAVLATGVLLTGCSSSVASATTSLQGVLETTVVHPDGQTVTGVDGMRLRDGDVVRTGPGGRAELVTRTRMVYVGSQAALQVLDGSRQWLRLGAAVVDAQHGPGLALQVAGLSVDAPTGSAVRAERSVTVRIGALAGSARITSSSGRTLTVPPLRQALVGGDALPATATPLRLTDDDGEAHAVPQLVRDDETLLGLARGIDQTGRSTVQVVTAAWHGPLSAPRGVARSERLLPAVIAAAGPHRGVHERYARAVAYRAGGGSWAVVARLVGVQASGVVATLAAFERTQPPGQVGSVAAVLADATGGTAGVPGSGTGTTNGPAGSGGGGGSNPGGSGTGGGGTGGSGSGSQSPTPSPSPSPGPVGQVVGTVGQTVGTVLKILPTPPPTLSAAPAPTVPLPVPSVTLPGLPAPR